MKAKIVRVLLIGLTVIGAFSLAACEHLFRPIVVSPQIMIVVNESAHKPSSPSSKLAILPACYLGKCDGLTNEDCAAQALIQLRSSQSNAWSAFDGKPAAIHTFAKRGYYVSLESKSPLNTIKASWSELGCISGDENLSASEARNRLCLKNMPDWIEVANKSYVADLAQNQEFRRVCLWDSPL